MPDKLLQNLICQVGEIIDTNFGILDTEGNVIAFSGTEPDESEIKQDIRNGRRIKENTFDGDRYLYQWIQQKGKPEYIAFIRKENENSIRFLELICMSVSNLKSYYSEKYDKSSFIKGVIQGRVPDEDIPLRAKELHIPYRAKRVVMLIRTEVPGEFHAYEVIQSMFPNKSKDFVIVMDDENTVLVKELKSRDEYDEAEKIAKNIVDNVSAELMVKVYAGISRMTENLGEIPRAYQEAVISLKIGSIFETDKYIVCFNKLGIGRLIYKLPAGICEDFLKEVFRDNSFDALDDEMLFTVQKFFENNLVVSETARQLPVHRNTLIYRLDKIEKVTGLDLRKFDDAATFKVALLVKKYLDRQKSGSE